MAASPSRTTGWSSARITRILWTGALTAAFILCLEFTDIGEVGTRQVDDDSRAFAGSAFDLELATNGAGAFAHVVQAITLLRVQLGAQRHAAAVVDHAHGPVRLFFQQHDADRARVRMTQRV